MQKDAGFGPFFKKGFAVLFPVLAGWQSFLDTRWATYRHKTFYGR